MMRALLPAMVVGVLGASAALAQNGTTGAPSSSSTAPPAISTSGAASKTTAAPVPGANSFTESEARSRIEAHGYSNVSNLTKDTQSIWRCKATKNGKPVSVALDYQGNVVSQ